MNDFTLQKRGFAGPFHHPSVLRIHLIAVASVLLTPCVPSMRAVDPYDKSLEARVEALERELDVIQSDSKGKNVSVDTDVPTFLRAAGKQVQELSISGDLRFRYNYQNEDFQYPGAGNQQQTSRYLYRLRLNLNYTFNDNWFAALGVTTNGAADSGNQQITGGFDDYGIYLHQFMLGWKAADFLTLEIGKIFVPFYNNSDGLVNWSNINPTGLTEMLNFDVLPQLNIKANFGQYVFYDNPESGYAITPTRIVTQHGRQSRARWWRTLPRTRRTRRARWITPARTTPSSFTRTSWRRTSRATSSR